MRLRQSLSLAPPETSREKRGRPGDTMRNVREEFERALNKAGVDIDHLDQAAGNLMKGREADCRTVITASERARRSYALLAEILEKILEIYHSVIRNDETR